MINDTSYSFILLATTISTIVGYIGYFIGYYIKVSKINNVFVKFLKNKSLKTFKGKRQILMYIVNTDDGIGSGDWIDVTMYGNELDFINATLCKPNIKVTLSSGNSLTLGSTDDKVTYEQSRT
jgi:hypothetical protein